MVIALIVSVIVLIALALRPFALAYWRVGRGHHHMDERRIRPPFRILPVPRSYTIPEREPEGRHHRAPSRFYSNEN